MLRRVRTMKPENENDVRQKELYRDELLSESLEYNINIFKKIFNNDETLIIREFENQQDNKFKCCILFIDGMVDNKILNENVIKPIVGNLLLTSGIDILDQLHYKIVSSNNVVRTRDINNQVEAVLYGDTVLIVEGSKEALIIDTKGWKSRNVDKPEAENLLRGSREGFTESILVNLSLIRRRLQTPDLKFKFRTLGMRSRTKVCICYIEGLANKKVLDELEKRLDSVDIDGVLDSGYIQEIIKDSPFSPYKTIGNTERPDAAAGKMLEGRIAIVFDGTPFVLTLPFVFIEYFQTNEDYYNNFYFASISRIIRILGFIITVSVPAIYVALTTFHQEMLPTPLILSISAARQGVPFPTIVEALVLLFTFEVLREAGTRMPEAVGQTVSIVGALVLGQAAVEARFVSAPMVIIVALTGITGLLLPKQKGANILIRIVFIFLAAFLGLYGYMFGVIALLIHLFGMRSFGVPYMLNIGSLRPQDIKDTAIRAPWWYMQYRPRLISVNNYIRKGPSKPRGGRRT